MNGANNAFCDWRLDFHLAFGIRRLKSRRYSGNRNDASFATVKWEWRKVQTYEQYLRRDTSLRLVLHAPWLISYARSVAKGQVACRWLIMAPETRFYWGSCRLLKTQGCNSIYCVTMLLELNSCCSIDVND